MPDVYRKIFDARLPDYKTDEKEYPRSDNFSHRPAAVSESETSHEIRDENHEGVPKRNPPMNPYKRNEVDCPHSRRSIEGRLRNFPDKI